MSLKFTHLFNSVEPSAENYQEILKAKAVSIRVSFESLTESREVYSLLNMITKVCKNSNTKLIDGNPYELVEKYFEYKGEVFQKEYFDLLESSIKNEVRCVNNSIFRVEREDMFKLINLLDYEEIFHWVKYIEKVKPLDKLKDKYEDRLNHNRVITYTKDEYLQLIAFSIGLKAIMPVLAQLAQLYNKLYKSILPLRIFEVVQDTQLFNNDLVTKLKGKVEYILQKEGINISAHVLKHNVTADSIVTKTLAQVLFDDLSIMSISEEDSGILATVYYTISNKLKNGNKSYDFVEKRSRIDMETLTEEPIVASFTQTTKFPLAREIEFGVTLIKDFDGVLKRLKLPNYDNIEEDKEKYFKLFKSIYINDNHTVTIYPLIIATYILSDELGLNIVIHLGREVNVMGVPLSLINAFVATAIYLEKNGFNTLLKLMFANEINDSLLLQSMKRYSLTDDFLEDLNNNFLFSTEIKNDAKAKPIVIVAITNLLNMISSKPLKDLRTGEDIPTEDKMKTELLGLVLKLFSNKDIKKISGLNI